MSLEILENTEKSNTNSEVELNQKKEVMAANEKAKNKKKFRLSRSNILMLICGLILIGSIILLLWPNVGVLMYEIDPPDENEYLYKVSNPALLNPDYQPGDTDVAVPADVRIGQGLPSDNWLIIPSAGVDSRIIEGQDINVLNRKMGSWREPASGSPLSDSNMVIACHRFQYRPPNTNTCYNLDKVKKGDRIVVYWKENGVLKDFVYMITEKFVVDPTDVWVRNHNPANGKELTIYTCGPEVFESSKRIVVKAVQL